MKKSPLSDLSFFKFPDLTTDVVQNIVLVILLMAVTAIVTVILQRWIHARTHRHEHRRQAYSRVDAMHEADQVLLQKLLTFSPLTRVADLLADSRAYETAVDAMAAQATEEILAGLSQLRRDMRRHVMNPQELLVSTRQLLPELPLRLVTSVGTERLDLYCDLLEVDERFMIFDLFNDAEVFQVLRAHPEVHLIYWREGGEEIVFRVVLEEVQGTGGVPLFRAGHVLRDVVSGQREEFRLSVDLPVQIHYISREALTKRSTSDTPHPREAEGRLLDISFGGASFVSERPMPPGGFAQLQFEIHGHQLRTMVEVLTTLGMGEGSYGGYLVRGRLRGLAGDARTRLNEFLTREQLRRLREKEVFHFKS